MTESDLTLDDVREVLAEAGRLASDVLDPLNRVADLQGVRLADGQVTTAAGFKRAYELFRSGGWTSAALPTALGGTMNLTEPQAGTDLAGIRTAAVPVDDKTWAVTGQKVFITWGEHYLCENIVHLVLARTPGAPAGLAGLSLFLVPKHLAEGYIVGEIGAGVPAMFVRMNIARVGIGIQALGVADRATQHAAAYAAERVQGRVLDRGPGTPIGQHPDVRRLLLGMGGAVDAMRALCLQIGTWLDIAEHGSPGERHTARALAEFFTPIFKSWSSEQAQAIAYDGVQVHGGMGFIEETGAAQFSRDARILPIYEGTTAIQANDLGGRKLLRDDVGDRLVRAMRVAVELTRIAGDQILAYGPRSRGAYAVPVQFLMLWGSWRAAGCTRASSWPTGRWVRMTSGATRPTRSPPSPSARRTRWRP